MEQNAKNVLTLEARRKLTMTNVESVDSFSDSVIVLTVEGQKVTISGSKLKILSFSQGGGNFSASGEVNIIKYSSGKRLSKLLK